MRIIVGVDGTDRGMKTLDAAVKRARAMDDELTVAVYTEKGPLTPVEERVNQRLAELDVDVPVELLEDSPGGTLVSRAEQDEYDCIVLPGGDRSPLGKIQFDSTVEFVLLNARTSVTLIR